MNISESITVCLDERGMMKKKLAERLGVSLQTISKLMKSTHCTGEMIDRLAAVFGLRASEFIALGEDKQNERN